MPRRRPERILVEREVTAVDTGEQIQAYVEVDAPKMRPKRSVEERWTRGDGSFTAVYHDHMARITGLSALEHDIFVWMLAHMAHDEPFTFVARQIAEDLMSSRTGVARALRTLRDLELVIALGTRMYVVDPRVAWRGERTKRREMLDRLRRDGLITENPMRMRTWTTRKTPTGSDEGASQDQRP